MLCEGGDMKTFAELKKELDRKGLEEIPNKNGYYIVYKPEGFEIKIKESTDAIFSYIKNGKMKYLIYPKEKLINKLNRVQNTEILYIGRAEREKGGLRGRITEFVKYGYGLCNNHRGGRAIWQIENNKALLLDYIVFEKAESKEKELLIDFKKKYSQYPFANWRL